MNLRKLLLSFIAFVLSVLLQLFLISKTQAQCNNLGQCTTAGLPVDCVPAPFAAGGAYGAAGSFFCIGNAVGVYSTSSGNIDNSWICWGDGTDTSFVGNFTDTIYHQFGFRPDSCFSGSNGILSNTIYIFVADSCPAGCTITWNSFPVSLRFMPHAEFSFLNTGDTVCVDEPICFDLTNACINQSSADSIWWDFGGGGLPFDTSRLFNPGCVSYSTPGTRTITVYLENVCGSSSFSQTVYVRPATTVSATITLLDSCTPATVIPVLIQNFADSLLWTSNMLTDTFWGPKDPMPILEMYDPGQHIIHLEAYGCCNSPQSLCDWYDTLTLLTGPVIVPSQQSFCQDSITINGSAFFSFAGSPVLNYDWIFEGADPDTVLATINPIVFFDSTGIYNVTLFATSSCGIDTVTTTLGLFSQPQLNLVSTPLTGCTPFNINISDTSNITQGYYWSAPGADLPNTAIGQVAAFTYSSAAGSPYTISVTAYTDSNSCPNVSQNIVVDIDEGVDLSMTQIPDTCTAIQFVFQDYFFLIPHANDTAHQWLIYILGDTIPFCVASGFPPSPPSFSVGGGAGPVTYVAIAIVESTCDSIALADTFMYAPPLPPQFIEDTVCRQSGIIQFTYNPPGGQWYDVNGILLLPGNDFFDPSTAVQYANIFYYTYGTASVCAVTDTFVYYVTGYDVSAGPDTFFCSNVPCLNLAGTPSGGWWEGTGVSGNFTGQYCPPAGVAIDIVTYTDTNGVCITTDTMIVTLSTGVSAIFNLDSIACIGDNILLSDTVAGTSASWMIDAPPWISSNSITYTAAGPAGDHTVWLAVTDSINGCTDTLQKIIHILAVPDAIFSLSPTDGCDSLEVFITDNSSFDSSVVYTWNYGLHDTNPDTLYLHAGINNTPIYQIIQLTSSNQCGIASHSDSVLVLPIPHANFGTSFTDTCSPALVRFNDNSDGCTIGICTYEWSINGAFFYSGVTPPETLLYAGAVDEVYHVQLITTNICGTDTISRDVIVHPSEVVAFFHTDNLYGCIPLTVVLTDFSTPINPTLLQWDFGDPGSAGNIDFGDTVTHTYTTAGDYVILHIVDNYCGLDTATQTVHVYDLPTVSFTATQATCLNEPVQFYNTSSALTSYLWDFGDSTTSDDEFSPLHYFPLPGNYIVTLTGNSFGDSTNSCTSVATQQVTVVEAPQASFALDSAYGCPPIAVDLISNSINATYYTWMISEGTHEVATLIGETNSYIFEDPGQYTITLTAINLNLCRDDSSYSFVSVYDSPDADFQPDPLVQSIFTPVFTFENLVFDTSAFLFYNWNFGDGTTDSNIVSPEHTYSAVGTYPVTFIVSNLFGCTDTIQKTVEVIPDFSVYIPNSFSPDGNGINDGFIPMGSGWAEYELWIFDRWGIEVFHSTDPYKAWNGKFQNNMQPCQGDVYVYKLLIYEPDGYNHEYVGRVTLLPLKDR